MIRTKLTKGAALAATVSALALGMAAAAPAVGPATASQTDFEQVVNAILDDPYQPAYVPAGFDSAFPGSVPNTFPVQDYTTGSVPGNPDHPGWPPEFKLIDPHYSFDGAPLISRLAMHEGKTRPGILVVHGFNTRAKESVIRWAAMMYKNGYHVFAADQRDFNAEFMHDPPYGWPNWLQTFGWKESEDVLAAGDFLKQQPGVTSVGVFGFSLGAQDTVLAMALDQARVDQGAARVFSAGMTFSGPADQNAQIYSTAVPPGCQPPTCDYPVTDALVAIVVPPYNRAPNTGKYDDPCEVLGDAAVKYKTTIPAILAREKAYLAQQQVTVPLLNFYAEDDSLVQPFHATMMAVPEQGKPLQRTYLIRQGEHAYFFDRWWQQKAILQYFEKLLPGAHNAVTDVPTVNPTPGGRPVREQLVPLGPSMPQQANSPLICPGGPTAVAAASFTARHRQRGAELSWRTASEVGVAGFHVYRGDVRLNRRLIAAAGTAAGRTYRFRDARGSRVARYSLEVVRLDGSRSRIAAVRAVR